MNNNKIYSNLNGLVYNLHLYQDIQLDYNIV